MCVLLLYDARMRVHWDRLDSLIVPLIVVAAVACGVIGAFKAGDVWGWLALMVAGLFLARLLDGERAEVDELPEVPDNVASIDGQGVFANGARR